MKNSIKSLIIIALLCVSANAFGQEQKPQTTYVENEFIIWLEQGVDAAVFAIQSDAGIAPKRMLSKRLNIWLFEITDKNESRDAKMDRLWNNHDVRLIQNNHTNVYVRESIPNDPFYYQQWAPAIMQLPQAWETYGTGGVTVTGDEIVVAVIDDGADLNHNDLSFWKNTHEIPNNGIDDDGNGYVDDYDGWDVFDHNGSIDVDNHGTHVSGIIGAIGNNGTGVCGVNWNVKVLPIVGSSGYESIVVEAYSYVLEMRARYNETNGQQGAFIVATNSSFGVDYGDPDDYPIWCAMYDEMGAEGILSSCAGPNMNVNVDVVGDIPSTCPGDFLIGITNTTSNDVKNSGAGFGVENIDIGAPGTGIYSTLPNNQYGSMTGTSMATPQVTGTIALMYSAMNEGMMQVCKSDPSSFCLSVRQSLFDGADQLASLDNLVANSRRLNAYGAIENMLTNWVAPALSGNAVILGDPVVGQTLTVEANLTSTPAITDLGQLSYQWLRDSNVIDGAVSSTYTLTVMDTDTYISVQVMAANCSGMVTAPQVGPVCLNTGVDEEKTDFFKVYPNPSNGIVNVEGKGILTITNTLGQTILSREIDGQTAINLPKGLYFVKMNGLTRKVVVD